MAITAVLPVIVFSWIYGKNIGIVAGLSTLPANFMMAIIFGLPWWDKVFMRGAGIAGTAGCVFMGLIIGHMRDLSMNTSKEILVRNQAENKIKKHQNQLNEQSFELQKKNKNLEEEIFQIEQLAINAKKIKDHLERFVSLSPDPIVIADIEGNIINPNKAFLDMIGYTEEEVLGRPIYHFVVSDKGVFETTYNEKIDLKEDYFQKTKEDVNRFLKEGKISNREIYFQRKDNKVVPVNQSIAMLKGEQVMRSAIFSIMQELTEQKKVEIALTEARRVAEEANCSKSAFLANMSHEIRTPMNGVIGFTDMLVETGLNPEQKDCALTIKRSGETLLSLINDILDFSKIDAGKMETEEIDFDVEMLAHDTCELIDTKIDKNRVELLCRIDDNLPAKVMGDPQRFRQVLVNLLKNAAKFTEEGEIELEFKFEEEHNDQIKLHTTVKDTGIGIPPEKLKSVFNLFHQADNSENRKYGGAGLGLSICKKTAVLLGGDVWAESEFGKGSTFHFTTWFKKAKMKNVQRLVPVSLSGKKVLIADDSKLNLEILTHILKSADMNVFRSSSETNILKTLKDAGEKNTPFDICILNIVMPDMNGYDVAKKIRAEHGDSIPLIAFSSSIEDSLEKCRKAGYNGFLPKPINKTKLYSMMERLLGKPEYKEEQSPAVKKDTTIATQYSIHEDVKHSTSILLAEDNAVNQKLATKLLTKAGYRVEIANNGKEALDIYLSSPEKYDVILMDIQMPELNGLETTKILRSKGFEQIPIIAMTANTMESDRKNCLESGMNDYISKPIRREVVFQILKKWIFEKA
jgi:PAS domain S-box-containing protein